MGGIALADEGAGFAAPAQSPDARGRKLECVRSLPLAANRGPSRIIRWSTSLCVMPASEWPTKADHGALSSNPYLGSVFL